MSTHAISDEEILAAWGGADGMSVDRRSETAADLRQLIESPGDGCAMIGRIVCCFEGYKVDVGRLRDSLGGWDRVWRSVLVDCGAERREDYPAMQVWQVKVAQRAKLYVTRDAVGRWSGHVAGRRLNFASPADLRERVKAAERLFRG